MPASPDHRPAARTSAPFGLAPLLVVVMALGCAVLWIGIPVAAMWAAAKVTETPAQHFLLALPVTVLAMILFAKALFSLNRLYLRVTLAESYGEEEEDEGFTRWARGPLEPMLVASLVIALVAFVVWFFVFAENPSRYGFVP